MFLFCCCFFCLAFIGGGHNLPHFRFRVYIPLFISSVVLFSFLMILFLLFFGLFCIIPTIIIFFILYNWLYISALVSQYMLLHSIYLIFVYIFLSCDLCLSFLSPFYILFLHIKCVGIMIVMHVYELFLIKSVNIAKNSSIFTALMAS